MRGRTAKLIKKIVSCLGYGVLLEWFFHVFVSKCAEKWKKIALNGLQFKRVYRDCGNNGCRSIT